MEAITMANGQLSFSCSEISWNFTCNCNWRTYSSHGFVNQWRPICGFPSYPQSSKNIRSSGSRIKAISNGDSDNRVVGGGLLEKDLEFKPSFDEYLKAMESVKTVREKKLQHKFSGSKLMDDSERNSTTSLGRTERRIKLRVQEFVDEESTSEILQNDELRNNDDADVVEKYPISGKRGYKERGTRESNVIFC